jgi:hypothetical protein
MFDHTHYVPILKGKQGEYSALQLLSPPAKAQLTPLIEVMLSSKGASDLQKGLKDLAINLTKSWDTGRPLFVDLGLMPGGGTRLAARVFREIRAKGLQAIPVTDLDRTSDYQQAVAQLNKEDGLGMCVRLHDGDFEDPERLQIRLQDLLGASGITPGEVDVVIDLRDIAPSYLARLTGLSRTNLATLPHRDDWRTLTAASTAFPESMAGLPAHQVSTRVRADWALWRGLVSGTQKPKRLPTFGDYAIQHPELVEYDPITMRVSPNIRYASGDVWLILRGKSVKAQGWEQVYGLARELVKRPEFRGAEHCWGCGYISRTAQREEKTGGGTVWRRVGTVHHLTTVIEQLSSFPWP